MTGTSAMQERRTLNWVGRAALLTPLAVIGLCGHCTPGAPDPPRPAARGFIALVGAGQDDPLWPVLSGSALQRRPGLGLIELRVAAPATASADAQIRLVRDLQREGMRGLCLQVTEPEAWEAPLRQMAREGVVVVTLLRRVPGDESYMHCGVDENMLGEKLADLAAEALKEAGTVAVLHSNATRPVSLDRYQAFASKLQTHPRLTVLREFDCGGDAERARRLIRECMDRYPRLNAWVAMGDWPLRGLGDAPLLPPGCKLIAADPSPLVWGPLADGRCLAIVGAAYGELAGQAVLQCAAALDGQMVRWKTHLLEPQPIWAANLHAYKLSWMKWCSTQAE